jgi:hypothetical protein
MKKIIMILATIAVTTLMGCINPANNPVTPLNEEGKYTLNVEIKTGSGATRALFDDTRIVKVSILVKDTAGVEVGKGDLAPGENSWFGTLKIWKLGNMTIEAVAYDDTNTPLYNGSTNQNITATGQTVTFVMATVSGGSARAGSFVLSPTTMGYTTGGAYRSLGSGRALGDNTMSINLGSITSTEASYFILKNGGDIPVTNVQMKVYEDVANTIEVPYITLTPSTLPVLDVEGTAGFVPIIAVTVNHGTSPISGVGIPRAPIGPHTVELVITGDTTDVDNNPLAIELRVDLVFDVKVVGVQATLDGKEVTWGALASVSQYSTMNRTANMIKSTSNTDYTAFSSIVLTNTGNVPWTIAVNTDREGWLITEASAVTVNPGESFTWDISDVTNSPVEGNPDVPAWVDTGFYINALYDGSRVVQESDDLQYDRSGKIILWGATNYTYPAYNLLIEVG